MNPQLDKFKFGYSTDINSDYSVVGNPSSFYLVNGIQGTGSVEIYQHDIQSNSYQYLQSLKKNYSSLNPNILIAVDSSSLDINLNADVPPSSSYDLLYEFNTASIVPVSDGYGQSVALSGSTLVVGCPYLFYSITPISGTFQYTGSVEIYNLPNTSASYYIYNSSSLDANNTFGESVSIEGNTLVVGSSLANSTFGAVYIYTQSANVWGLTQTFTGSQAGHLYGGTVRIDPSGSKTIVVGHKSTGSFGVDVYKYNTVTTQWSKSTTLQENKNITGSLNFINYSPVLISNNSSSYYGSSVAIYGNNIVVGAPSDMYYLEYAGSPTPRNRGAVYFYNKCSDNSGWALINKSYGNEKIQKTNNLGSSVSIYNNYAVVTNAKDVFNFSSSYINNTINKKFDCGINDAFIDTLGQFALYEVFTSSMSQSWNVVSVIDKKKQYGFPYTTFGYSSAINNKNIIIGSPLFLVNPSEMTSSTYDVIKGHAYIYNLNDLYNDYQVGNIFYRNGKLIFSNSGSTFDGLLKDKTDQSKPLYDITYKSQLTVYEKQVVCRIEPGEFNYSTNPTALIPNVFLYDIDGNGFFDFVDLDLILRYISLQINGSQTWTNYLTLTDDELSLISYYYTKFNLMHVDNNYINNYATKLAATYSSFDIDGNGRVYIGDMYLLWKYFVNKLTKDIVFNYVDTKSIRKNHESILRYLDEKTGKYGYGKIKPEFFNFEYSSSLDKTGSYLAPYITTVGLYNGADLIAVAKLGMPIKNSGELPLNILVKWDI